MQALEIQPTQGIGAVTFGMKPDQVTAVFGSKQVYEAWMGGNLNDSLLYHGLIFRFDRCNSHGPLENASLEDIQVWRREDASLYGKPIHDWTKQELKQYLIEHNIECETPANGDLESAQIGFEASFDENGRLLCAGFWQPHNQALHTTAPHVALFKRCRFLCHFLYLSRSLGGG